MFADTIFALSSGRLPSGVAVIRLSGDHCRFVCETISGALPPPRRATLCALRSSEGALLDNGLVLWFPGPASFTGEDCLEFHLHGGVAVVKAMLREIGRQGGLRPAEPGEFTRRAFINGKLDLVQAEALSDLIAAETEAQRRLAANGADGRESALYRDWRERLVTLRAAVEAELDFSDERDVPEDVGSGVLDELGTLAAEMELHCRGYARAEMIRDGFNVVLAGAPNAGKSSLLNALAKRDVAIVSPEAGTTRDLIEVSLDLDGYKVRLTDTAGLRRTGDAVEIAGVERARRRIAEADLVLMLTDMCEPVAVDGLLGTMIRVGTKADLCPGKPAAFDICVSAVTGAGIPELLSLITDHVSQVATGVSDVMPSQLRHVALIEEARRHVETAISHNLAAEILAESLRQASKSLGRITGEIDVEDILSSIFSRFCIGK